MYAGDHIVLSATLSILVAHRLKLNFVSTCAWLIFINALDLDHLLYGKLDNGTADSLCLHPLHHFAGTVMFLITLYALLKPQKAIFCLGLISGYCLHLAADALADLVHYRISALLLMDIIWFPLFILVSTKFLLKGPRLYFQLCILGCWLFCNLDQGFIDFILHDSPRNHPVLTYFSGGILPALAAGLVYYLFRNKSLEVE